ncbi:unnamed protein product [Porites lobata]|uniref:Uncharacterized protein n=1 Tax=Porites lobata TaxID=104759 RepID=A0ABN8Q7X3_9CNID|nr:unnamed protein product [Porites lobata]
MDTSSDSGSSATTDQSVVPFALGQGPNTNQAIRPQNDHQANQARYGPPNMVAASSHLQPQAGDDMPDPVAVFLFLFFICLTWRKVN